MKRVVTGMASALALLLVAGSAAAQDAKAVERGKQLYGEKKCSMCHSIEGKGNAKGPLDDVGSKFSAAELKQWLTDPKTMATKAKSERKPPMPSYATMPAADIDALVAYLQTLKKK
jgi:mono/diheme cytochrome c family protein